MPEAYFWVGNSKRPDNKGQIVPYPPQGSDDFGSFSGYNSGRQSRYFGY